MRARSRRAKHLRRSPRSRRSSAPAPSRSPRSRGSKCAHLHTIGSEHVREDHDREREQADRRDAGRRHGQIFIHRPVEFVASARMDLTATGAGSGLLAIFAVMLLKEIGVPVPVPSDLIMVGAGVQIASGAYSALALALAVGLAVLIGASIQLLLARSAGRALVGLRGRADAARAWTDAACPACLAIAVAGERSA